MKNKRNTFLSIFGFLTLVGLMTISSAQMQPMQGNPNITIYPTPAPTASQTPTPTASGAPGSPLNTNTSTFTNTSYEFNNATRTQSNTPRTQ